MNKLRSNYYLIIIINASESFCRLSTNAIMPVSLFLNPVFHFDFDYCINAVMTKVETNVQFILFKDGNIIINNLLQLDGIIDGFSSRLLQEFELNLENSELLNELHIMHLMPNLMELA